MSQRLAIVIPTYNRRELLVQCIQSCLDQPAAQSWSVAIFVVDDGSTDQSSEKIRELFEVEFQKQKIFLIEIENSERGKARNVGADFALKKWNANWLLFLDADDLLASTSLPQILARMSEEAQLISAKYQTLRGEKISLVKEPATPKFHRDLNLLFLNSNPLALGTTLVRKDIYLLSGGFPEDRLMSGSEDWVFLWRASHAAKGNVQFLEMTLTLYRQHAENTSIERSRTSMQQSREALQNFIHSHFGESAPWAQSELFFYHSLCLAGACNSQGKPTQALIELMKILRHSPRRFWSFRFWRVLLSSITKLFGR